MTKPEFDAYRNQRWFNSERRYHRVDGPAVIYADGTKWWYIDGSPCFDNKSYQKAAKLSDEDMLMITLKHGNVNE